MTQCFAYTHHVLWPSVNGMCLSNQAAKQTRLKSLSGKNFNIGLRESSQLF